MGVSLDDYWKHPRQTRLRYWLFQIHLWAGIGVGLYILAISLSGSALVFREELEANFPPSARAVTPSGERASLEQVRRSVADRFPGYRVAWIREPERSDLAHDVWFEHGDDARLVLVNPYSASILEEVGPTSSVWFFLQDLHFYLFAGRIGFLINGVGGLLLGLLTLTGLAIWWPGPKEWVRALVLRRGVGWKRFNWDLHSALGFWTLVFVSVWALTGAYFAFPEPFVAAVRTALPVSAPPEVTAPQDAQQQAPTDVLVEAAMRAVPGHRPDWVGLPHHDGEHLATIYLVPASGESTESTYVHVNAHTAEVLRVDTPEERLAGDALLELFASLHFGTFGGWPVKALWAALGLAPAVLFVTGFLMWWNRVLSKRWSRWRSEMPTASDAARHA